MDYETAGPGKRGFRYKIYIMIERRKKYRNIEEAPYIKIDLNTILEKLK